MFANIVQPARPLLEVFDWGGGGGGGKKVSAGGISRYEGLGGMLSQKKMKCRGTEVLLS